MGLYRGCIGVVLGLSWGYICKLQFLNYVHIVWYYALMCFEDVKVFIDPLPFEKDTQELSQFLSAFGEVEEVAWLGLVEGLSEASVGCITDSGCGTVGTYYKV